MATVRQFPKKTIRQRATHRGEMLPPQSQEAEAAVIGSILIDREAVATVRGIAQATHFYTAANREVIEAIYELDDAGVAVDLVTLSAKLEEIGKLEELGGYAALSEYTNRVPTSANVEHYARIVAKLAAKRAARKLSTDLAMLSNSEGAISELVEYVEGAAADLRAEYGTIEQEASQFHSLSLLEMRNLPKPTSLVGNVLWQESVHILYGESSTWKSKVALSLALSIATGRYWLGQSVVQGPVLYIAGEGGPLVAWDALAWLNYYGIYTDQLDRIPFRLLTLPPDLCDIDQVHAFISASTHDFEAAYGQLPAFIVADTLATSMSGNENDAQDVNIVYQSLRAMQREMGCSCLLVHHVGKDPSRKERGNYAIRANADATMVIDTGDVDGGQLEPGMPISLLSDKPYKGAPKFAPINLTTTLHTLVEESLDQSTHLVVIPSTSSPVPRPGKETAGPRHMSNLLTMVRDKFPSGVHHADLKRAFMEKFDVSSSVFDRAYRALMVNGNLVYAGSSVFAADELVSPGVN